MNITVLPLPAPVESVASTAPATPSAGGSDFARDLAGAQVRQPEAAGGSSQDRQRDPMDEPGENGTQAFAQADASAAMLAWINALPVSDTVPAAAVPPATPAVAPAPALAASTVAISAQPAIAQPNGSFDAPLVAASPTLGAAADAQVLPSQPAVAPAPALAASTVAISAQPAIAQPNGSFDAPLVAASPTLGAAADAQVLPSQPAVAPALPASTAIQVSSSAMPAQSMPKLVRSVPASVQPSSTSPMAASTTPPPATDGQPLEPILGDEPFSGTLQTSMRSSIESGTLTPADSLTGQGAAGRSEALPATGLTSTAPPSASASPAATSATLATPFGAPQWSRSLGEHVIALQQRGDQQIELRLNPADLGPLSISLKLGDNAAHLQFFSAHPQVRSAIEQALPQLREALAEQGISLGQTSVGEQHRQPGAPLAEGERTDADSAGRATEETPPLEQAMARASQRLNSLDGRIDLYA